MEELKTIITEFREKRGWEKYDTLERFSKSISIEAAELLEHFTRRAKKSKRQSLLLIILKTRLVLSLSSFLLRKSMMWKVILYLKCSTASMTLRE